MPTKTPKSWKSTEECIELVEAMSANATMEVLRYKGKDNQWYWRITLSPRYPAHDTKIEDEETHIYEDGAANEGYKWAYKHLRPKRRKKKKL